MTESGRRRSGLGIVVAVASVAAVVVATTLGIQALRGDSDDAVDLASGPTVPATSQALMAVALSHVDGEPSGFSWLFDVDLRYGPGTLGGEVRFNSDGEYDGDLLRVTVTPDGRADSCSDLQNCDTIKTDLGTAKLSWAEEMPEEDPGVVSVSLERDGELARVYQAGPTIKGDPRRQQMAISVDDMLAIVSDPLFSLETRQGAVDAGEQLGDWGGKEEVVPTTAPSDGEPWAPRGLAALVNERLGGVERVEESGFVEPDGLVGAGRGVHVEYDYTDGSLDLLLVEDTGRDAIACPEGWKCFGGAGVTYAWKGEQGAILRDRGYFVVRAYIRDTDFGFRSELDFLVDTNNFVDHLTRDPELGLLMDPKWSERGSRLRVWMD